MSRAHGTRQIDRSSPAWVLTYADVATLLLVFFIFLFSASELSEAKFQAATGSLRASLGRRPHRASIVEMHPEAEVSRRERQPSARWGAPGERTEVLAAARGRRVVLGGSVLFERGSAELAAKAKEDLRRVADEVRGLPNIVEVHGHAERGEGPAAGVRDDLALSLARAANVLRFLVADGGLRLARLRVRGAGSQEPAAEGLYDEASLNRRVEVIVVREAAVPPRSGGLTER